MRGRERTDSDEAQIDPDSTEIQRALGPEVSLANFHVPDILPREQKKASAVPPWDDSDVCVVTGVMINSIHTSKFHHEAETPGAQCI
jgi:hypothetical protein